MGPNRAFPPTPGSVGQIESDRSFPAAVRLHDGREFGRVFWRQQKAAGRSAVVLVAPRPGHQPRAARLGIMVSTKVARDAVRRHQLKRWVRELFRTRWKRRAHGHDVVVLFRQDPPADGHAQVDAELDRLLAAALVATPQPGSGQGRREKRR